MSNSFRMLTLSGLFLVTFLGFPPAQAALLVNFNGQCLTAIHTANGTPLETIPCFGIFAQKWNWLGPEIKGIGTHGGDGKCVTVGGTVPGTPVQLIDCNGTEGQRWDYNNGNIVSLSSLKCLDVGDGFLARATIQLCGGRDREGQRWTIR